MQYSNIPMFQYSFLCALSIDLNRQAYAALRCEKRLVIVPGASHLFEEPGTLEEVARLAGAWFTRHLAGGARPA